MPSPRETLGEFDDPSALPADSRALFNAGLFDSLAWYSVVAATAVPPGARPAFLVFGASAAVVFPMLRCPRGAASLTTPYTCRWAPVTAARPDTNTLIAAGRALAKWCRAFGAVRLDCMEIEDPRWESVLRGVRAGFVQTLRFDHFGNWTIDLHEADFDRYMAARPGALRTTFKRQASKHAQFGSTLHIARDSDGLDGAIAAFEHVYARSWKQAEPFPAFNAALMRACAAAGSLRLARLDHCGRPVAAQFWTVQDGTATVLKLAHDEAEKASSPGTVLTGLAIRALMSEDHVKRLDFGRGDDIYKRDWTNTRHQRVGVVLADPRHPRGVRAIARHLAGRLRAGLLAR